jgi:release factor glutamine methyltransferase
MRLAKRLCRRLAHALYDRYVFRHAAAPSSVRLLGRRLLTDPQVFHPAGFLSTRILAAYVDALDLRGKRFLDMGTGSGAIGIFAAGRGASVTACDVNPHALALARENARRNHVQLEIVASDLFAALAGRRFDVIAFNIPFYPKVARSHLEAAFFAGPNFETVHDFAAGCSRALAPGGVVVIILSEDSGYARISSIFASAGLTTVSQSVTTRLFERFHVVCFRPAG